LAVLGATAANLSGERGVAATGIFAGGCLSHKQLTFPSSLNPASAKGLRTDTPPEI